MKKIAIRFSDNDFHCTFINVLKVIGESFKYNDIAISKERFVALVNKMSPVIYTAFQNTFTYNDFEKFNSESLDDNEHYTHIESYLKISTKNVLYDKEVDDYYDLRQGWSNSETFVLEFYKDKNNELDFSVYSF